MKVGLIHNWPGKRNSELDLAGRIDFLLRGLGHTAHVIDPVGNSLDFNGEYQGGIVDDLDFVINLHFSSPNYTGFPSYVTNWNPIRFLTADPSTNEPISLEMSNLYREFVNSNSFYLSAGSQVVDKYIESVHGSYLHSELAGSFYTTSRIYDNVHVNLSDPKIFYIGVNWERLSGTSRHQGLFEQLDSSNIINFYGVKEISGINLWEGIKNYKGELPFDGGDSIVRVSNECGISLVLSTDAHKESELVSTRLFQACAAKTVIISDNNPFIVKNFGDCVLTLDLDGTVSDYGKIKAAYDWIIENPTKAIEYANESHKRFCDNFSLDSQLKYLLSHYESKLINFSNANYSVSILIESELSDKNVESLLKSIVYSSCVDFMLFVTAEYFEKCRVQFDCMDNVKLEVLASSNETYNRYCFFNRVKSDFTMVYSEDFCVSKSIWFEAIHSLERSAVDIVKLSLSYCSDLLDENFENSKSIQKYEANYNSDYDFINCRYIFRTKVMDLKYLFSGVDVARFLWLDSKCKSSTYTPLIMIDVSEKVFKSKVDFFNKYLGSRVMISKLIRVKENLSKYKFFNKIYPTLKRLYFKLTSVKS